MASLEGDEMIFANHRARQWEEEGRAGESGYRLFAPLAKNHAQLPGGLWRLESVSQQDITAYDKTMERWFLFRERVIDWVDRRPVRLQAVTDVTERQQLDGERQRMEKLESLYSGPSP